MEWSWKTFLSPLSGDDRTSVPSSEKVEVSKSQSLVRRFSRDLQSEHKDVKVNKDKAIKLAKKALQRLLGGDLTFENLEKKWKAYQEAMNMKSDRDRTGSTWTIDMLESYIERKDIVFIQPLSSHATAQQAQNIVDKVALALASLCGNQGDGIDRNLRRFRLMRDSTETDSRMILDAILQPLCAAKGLTLRCEQTLTCDELPNSRYDYIIYFEKKPIGIVEAKRQSCVCDKSVAQLINQLLLLSAEDPYVFRFGVLSDAHRFILAGVSQKKVVFFQTNVDAIQIRFMKSEENLLSITDEIAWLIDLAVKSRENKRSIERYLDEVVCYAVDSKFFS